MDRDRDRLACLLQQSKLERQTDKDDKKNTDQQEDEVYWYLFYKSMAVSMKYWCLQSQAKLQCIYKI